MKWQNEDIYAIERYGSSPPKLLIELPHGCVHTEEYNTFAQHISELPSNLIDFFLVNTDVGTPELAQGIAKFLEKELGVIVLRSRIPRTLIDCNRVLSLSESEYKSGKVTPGIPSYIPLQHHPWLTEIHQRYTQKAAALYQEVCSAGGTAIMLHSYSPRSVGIENVDDQIVKNLHWAYQPDVYHRWPLRPEVDFIAKKQNGEWCGAKDKILSIKKRMEKKSIKVGISTTYPMHPATTAYTHAQNHPQQTMCIEIRRDLLMKNFRPFAVLEADNIQIHQFSQYIGLDFLHTNE